ncbi:MAG: pilus assembly protein [Coriobacteriales bacterium]|jgi:hypothetical protein|nr:pilus assembly protein [Coriobacteriales bacterium]
MRCKKIKVGCCGQATVEASFLIPILFALILLLLQPGILLYNHMVMSSAAAEGCRVLATATQQGADGVSRPQAAYENYVLRRLAAIPPIDPFHTHGNDDGCIEICWDITVSGDENSQQVSVNIKNWLKPLPLLGLPASLLGLCDENGWIKQEVEVTMPTQPDWVWQNSSGGPMEWVRQWD